MAKLLLTAEKAFIAAKELKDKRISVNSTSLWTACERLGSLTTAKKWADLWNAIERGEAVEAKYEHLWEVVNAGQELPKDPDEPMPENVRAALDKCFAEVWEIVAERIKEATEQAGAVAVAEIEEAQQERLAAVKQLTETQQCLTELGAELQTLKERLQSVTQENATLQTKKNELETELSSCKAEFGRRDNELQESLRAHAVVVAEKELVMKERQREQERIATLEAKVDKLQGDLANRTQSLARAEEQLRMVATTSPAQYKRR
jgi:chromosome segregation ATPase